jgi:regulator of RNase E activity RraA
MVVSPNDVIHADRHGAVVVPAEAVKDLPAAADLLARREKVVIDAARAPGFSVERLRRAFDEQDEIH